MVLESEKYVVVLKSEPEVEQIGRASCRERVLNLV